MTKTKRKYTRHTNLIDRVLKFPFWGSQINTKLIFARVGMPHTNKDYPQSYGDLQKYAWPGGYPIYYITNDACAMCPACATKQAHHRYDWPKIIGAEINWESQDLYCENCNKQIESAYGNN